jgi:hypothetical protein
MVRIVCAYITRGAGWQPQGLRPWGWLDTDAGPVPFVGRAIPKAFGFEAATPKDRTYPMKLSRTLRIAKTRQSTLKGRRRCP